MRGDDRIRFLHMAEAMRQAMAFVHGKQPETVVEDRMSIFALVKCVEIVGEAASRISEDTRNQHPLLPWPEMITMRNRLVHAYFDIDAQVVWDTITEDFPPLLQAVETILIPPA